MIEPGSLLAWALALIADQAPGDARAPALPCPRAELGKLDADERAFVEGYPEQGTSDAALSARAQELLTGHLVHGRSPQFMNQLFSGVHDPGIAGALLGLAANNTLSTREVAPLPSAMESAVLSWMLRSVPWDRATSGGSVTPGGSFSNYLAVHLARRRACAEHGDDAVSRLALFTSRAGHYSIGKGADFAGMPSRAVVEVDADAQNRMVPAALATAIDEARARGQIPFLVNATLGTTVAGTLDPVPAIAEIATSDGLWLHVDGAWGAYGLLGSESERFARGLEHADSLTWDAHKSAGSPTALSFLLVRERQVLDVLRPAGDRGSYLFQGSDDGPDEELAPRAEDLGLTSVYCGKPFLSLALWMLWKSLGADGLRAHVDRARAMALRFRARVAATGLYEVTHETDTWAVCFRPRTDAGADVATRDAFSNRVHDAVNADGTWMIRLCPARGGRVFRAIFTNPLMTDEVADRFVAALVAAHAFALQENPA